MGIIYLGVYANLGMVRDVAMGKLAADNVGVLGEFNDG
jgi:hypothetical protein